MPDTQGREERTVTSEREIRFIPSDYAEFRIHEEDGVRQLVYTAPPWDSLSVPIMGRFRERFARGAFDLSETGDVFSTVEHDNGKLLGRTSAGTLRISESDGGLVSTVDLPDTTYSRDLVELVRTGNIRGASFEFESLEEDATEDENGFPIRTVTKARLFQTGPVSRPAYQSSDVALRSINEWIERRGCTPRLDIAKRRLVLADL